MKTIAFGHFLSGLEFRYMKNFGTVILCFLMMSRVMAQDCEQTFVSNYLKLSICNDQNWEIEQALPYIKVKAPELQTYITIFSEPYDGSKNSEELAEESFASDRLSYPTLVKTR